MERDYGRIRTEYEFSENIQDFIRMVNCTTCEHKDQTKDSVKRHRARGNGQLGRAKDIFPPNSVEMFAHLGSPNRHIYH